MCMRRSVHPSVCLSVHHKSCPLYNLKTIKDISMKLGTRINHDELMTHAQEPLLLLAYLWSYSPLITFHTILCPLFNSKTVRDVLMKLGTLIKHDEMMCHAKEP